MNENFTYWLELIDKRLQSNLSEEEKVIFNNLIAENTDFEKLYRRQKQIAQGIKLAEKERLKQSLKIQLQQDKESDRKNSFFYIFWLSQYSAAIWLVAISITITLSSVWLYRAWQKKQAKKAVVLQWEKAEELLNEPTKKQEIILYRPDSVHTHNTSPSRKETTIIVPYKPTPKQNIALQPIEDISTKKEAGKYAEEIVMDDEIKNEKRIDEDKSSKIVSAEPVPLLSDMVEEDKQVIQKKKEKTDKAKPNQKNNIKEFYLPVYALRIQDEIQNRNFTAAPENIKSGRDVPRATKSTVGPKVFVTQYTDKKVQENTWYYDFIRDSSGEHLFIYADFDYQYLQLYIDRKPSPTKYYLKTRIGVFVLYPNQTQKLAEIVTDKKILKYLK